MRADAATLDDVVAGWEDTSAYDAAVCGTRLAGPGLGSLGVYVTAPHHRGDDLRPPAVRVTGPLGGQLVTDDPDRLRAEAAVLLAAADYLDRLRPAWEAQRDAERPLLLF